VNVREYISSGVLESYAAGALTEEERGVVEQNLERYAELRAELLLIEDLQERILTAAAVQPPEIARRRLLEKIDIDDAGVIPLLARSIPWKLATAASVSIALIASFFAYSYYKNWQKSETNLVALTRQNQQIATDYNQVRDRLDDMEGDLRVMTSPNFKRVMMTGTANAPEALAMVYWNEKTSEVFVHIHEMKELAQEKQYQLWAFVDGKPVDAGVFDGNMAGLIPMKRIGKGAVKFAVTVEDRGGKPLPTVETIQMAGDMAKS
jgi:anti-sigma-K factor RskA